MPRMKVTTTVDHSTTVIEFLPGSGASGVVTLNKAQLDTLLAALRQARETMNEAVDSSVEAANREKDKTKLN